MATQVGQLHLESIGTGPPTEPWHSAFVDSRSWHRVVDELARDRRLVLITGPDRGRSGDPGRRHTMEDCARAAASVLDALGMDEPVDWVGNAWGGLVGIAPAARQPSRIRTLITVGTPVHAYSLKGRLETRVLPAVYRIAGPTRFLRNSITDVLLAQRTRPTILPRSTL